MTLAGTQVVVKMDDASGTIRTFADGEIISADLGLTFDQHDISNYSHTIHTVINGLLQAPVILKGYLTATADVGTHTVIQKAFAADAQVSLRVTLNDSSESQPEYPEYQGEFVVESYTPVIESNRAVTFTATLKPATGIAPVWVQSYVERVKRTKSSNLIGYWPLWEASGTDVLDQSGCGHDGTATGVTWGQSGIGDGESSAGFDGVNDLINIYSTGLGSKINGAEGTMVTWFRVASAGVWSDGTQRTVFLVQGLDATNLIWCTKTSTANELKIGYGANAVWEVVTTTLSETGWVQVASTWSKSADEFKAYVNGQQVDTTRTGLGNWQGPLNMFLLGARNLVPVNMWYGDLAHAALWDTVLTAGEIAALAGV